MQFSNPIPRGGLPRRHLSSPLRSLRDSDSTGKQWIRDKITDNQVRANTNSISKLQRTTEQLKRRMLAYNPSGTGFSFRGEYDPTASYAVNDVVVIRAGYNAGSFVCIQANSGQSPQLPDIGNLYWVSLSGNVPVLGAWMA